MAKFNWIDITRNDVINAIEKFLTLNPEYPKPRSTFLVYEGKKLPAKHIRGMAYQEHFGVPISKNDFGGGMETVKFFERLSFEMDYRGVSKDEPKKPTKTTKQTAPPSPIIVEKAPVFSYENKVKKINDIVPKAENNHEVKIKVPSKGVIEQKNALQLILNRMFAGDIVCEKTYPWLKTPNQIEGNYKKLYDALSNYRGDTAFAKKGVTLRCDFVCENQKLIIEYDERQHFSEARKISLEAYNDVPVFFDRSLWINACQSIGAKDNTPYNRDETRAYYDSVRDIACHEQGYRLVRIMHGQIDFESEDAAQKLQTLLDDSLCHYNSQCKNLPSEDLYKAPSIKVAMYLQTDELKNKRAFEKMLPIFKQADFDILVFPEYCYVPFINVIANTDITSIDDQDKIFKACLNFSKEIGKAVIVSSHDKFDTIYSVFANAQHKKDETEVSLYIKHTMCGSSCLEFEQYPEIASYLFDPIAYKGYLIGMTICYDCNHALFSRLYGIYGIDLIINSTGGNVVYDKWFKYNKVRAIENNCYTLVTMGGNGLVPNGHNYVFGFNKNGGRINPTNLCGDSSVHNMPGGLYVYEISCDPGMPENDISNQFETENKKWNLNYPVGGSKTLLADAVRITDQIYLKHIENSNVFFLMVNGNEIMKPEKIQPLLYSDQIKKYNNRKYVIINRHDTVELEYFKEKLSIVLKVRSMENFCAVVLESKNINKCYQCGKNRTAQVVKAVNGCWGIDLERTSGPEAIWKNKVGMKASWRKNYEWLVANSETLYNEW